MNALTVCNDDFLLEHTGIADVVGIVGHILNEKKRKKSELVNWSTNTGDRSILNVCQYAKRDGVSCVCGCVYLKQTQFVRPANVGVLVPATIRIFHTTEATVVPSIAHRQIDLFDTIVRGHIQWFSRLTYFHYLNRFIRCDLEYVQ